MEGSWRDPEIADGEWGTYRGKIAGEEQGEGRLGIEAHDSHYVQRIDMHIADALDYELQMRFGRKRGEIRAEHYELHTSHKGKPVAHEQGWFRDVQILHWGGDLIRYPRDIAPLLGCALAIRGLEFEPDARHTFPLWLANTIFWEIELKVERREDVTVPAGSFNAWRVLARPSFEELNVALDKLIGAVLPPFVLHFEADHPHRFLRFAFPTGPFPWNPRGLIEATEFG